MFFQQLIHLPTRVTLNTKTIIDLIFTSCPEKHAIYGVIPVTLSDHFMLYSVLNEERPTIKLGKHISVTKRNYSTLCIESFKKDIALSSVFCHLVYCNDVNQAWNSWLEEYNSICNKHAPIHHHRIKNRNKPWVSSEIRQIIQERDFWHKLAIKYKNPDYFNRYKSLRNEVTYAIRLNKVNFVQNEIQRNEGKPDKAWKTLKHFLPSKHQLISPSELDANTFNKFFSSIGIKATEHYGDMKLPKLQFPGVTDNFIFPLMSSNYVHTYLDKLPNSRNLDSLNFDNYLLKTASSAIAPSLTHIFNLSLLHGTVPSCWKTASVTPIFKGKGDKGEFGNYRHISIVPTVAKIIELFVKEQLVHFLQKHNVLTPSQFAYKKVSPLKQHYILLLMMHSLIWIMVW